MRVEAYRICPRCGISINWKHCRRDDAYSSSPKWHNSSATVPTERKRTFLSFATNPFKRNLSNCEMNLDTGVSKSSSSEEELDGTGGERPTSVR